MYSERKLYGQGAFARDNVEQQAVLFQFTHTT